MCSNKRKPGRPTDKTLADNPRIAIDIRLKTRRRLFAFKKKSRLTYDRAINLLLDKVGSYLP